jgi:gliding motility-associated-like protein
VDLPKAEINFKDTTICKGQPLKIRQLNELNSLSREWSINNSVVSAEKEFDASFTEIGTSLIKLVVIGEASCRDSAFAKVSTFSAPRSVIKVNNALQCLNNNLFNFRSEDTLLRLNLLYSWNLGDSTFAQTPTVIHKYEKPGIYNVALVLITEKGCRDTAAIDVIVEPEINSVRYETKNLIVNTTVPLEARNFQGATYSWSPKFQLSNYNERKTNFNGADPVEYLIDIKTPAGCKATDTLSILIFQEDDVFVPDVFTPNNDGQNDYFFPFYTRNIKLEYFKIFNRWGNLIYNSSSPKPGWDGTYNGLAQPIGAYVWVLEAVDLAGKKIRKKGNFMLLK